MGRVILDRHLVLGLDDLRSARLLLQVVGNDSVGRFDVLFKIGFVRARHDHIRAIGHIGSHAAGMVHMLMGQDEILDRLARIFRLRCVDDPA